VKRGLPCTISDWALDAEGDWVRDVLWADGTFRYLLACVFRHDLHWAIYSPDRGQVLHRGDPCGTVQEAMAEADRFIRDQPGLMPGMAATEADLRALLAACEALGDTAGTGGGR